MVDFGARLEAVLFEHPVDLLLLAPYHAPVLPVGLTPLAGSETAVDAVAEGCFELDALAEWGGKYGGVG
jgi:hypothetical protein